MEFYHIIIIAVVLHFVWQGFRVRCPNCGFMALHRVDTKAERKLREQYQNLKNYVPKDRLMKPGYQNRNFICSECNERFNRKTALAWLTLSNKLGDDIAIETYQAEKEYALEEFDY